VTRALLWLVGGLVVFVLAVLLTAPELLGAEESQLAGLAGVAVAAGIPGIVIVLVLVAKRHSPDPDEHARPPADPHRHPSGPPDPHRGG
jgi:cation transporter-like permease